MSVNKMILCGDSWAWGYELVDPTIEKVPVAMKMASPLTHKLKNSGNMDPWNVHNIPGNLEYRLANRYAGKLSKMLEINEVIDLSLPGASNEYMERELLVWLSDNGYLSGKDTSDIFVMIGWTSPERREFRLNKGEIIHYGSWFSRYEYGEKDIDDFIKLYMTYFNSEKESILRYFMQVLTMQKMLKSYNIKFLMHQVFYDGMHWKKLEDLHSRKKITNKLTQGELNIWDQVEDHTFVNKNITASQYLRTQNTRCFFKEHPNEKGHMLLAELFYKKIKGNNIL